MSVIFIVIPLAIVLAAIAVAAFFWAARDGQFDDVDTAAIRMINDDESADGRRAGGDPS